MLAFDDEHAFAGHVPSKFAMSAAARVDLSASAASPALQVDQLVRHDAALTKTAAIAFADGPGSAAQMPYIPGLTLNGHTPASLQQAMQIAQATTATQLQQLHQLHAAGSLAALSPFAGVPLPSLSELPGLSVLGFGLGAVCVGGFGGVGEKHTVLLGAASPSACTSASAHTLIAPAASGAAAAAAGPQRPAKTLSARARVAGRFQQILHQGGSQKTRSTCK